ncbi:MULTISPECIES: hypothetical protein [unclassified Streptomyces]|uniref:hypothetical protein n=1 Tax=unclassified Streptomyces TaxID=2593676 RepID=UPI0033E43847
MRRSLVLLTATAMLCAACTGAGDDEKPRAEAVAAVRDAVTATSHTSARFTSTLTTPVVDPAKPPQVKASGSIDLATGNAPMTVTHSSSAVGAEEILYKERVYMRPAVPMNVAVELDDRWGVDLRRTAETHTPFRPPLNDPAYTLQQVARMKDVRAEGTETVHGVPTERYRGTLDHRTLTLRLATESRENADLLRDAYGSDLPIAAQAWVDHHGRLVQARFTLKDRTVTHAVMTLSFTDLGTPVPVTPPSHDEDTAPLHDQLPTGLTG